MPKVLVTGGKGMLGTDLCRHFEKMGHQVVCTDLDELDIRDLTAVMSQVEQHQPNWIIHLAAVTNVDNCEQDPELAYAVNTVGTHNVAMAAKRMGATLLYVSTIAVFDGTKQTPNHEFDLPNPQSVYSQSKYQGEQIVQSLLDNYLIVRAGWMFGGGLEDKKFVAKIIELAMEKEKLQVVKDKFGSPTYTYDFAVGAEKLLNTNMMGTFHLVNSGHYCSRYHFAQSILDYAGIKDCQIEAVTSSHFPLPAHRPRMEAAINYQLELRGLNWQRPWPEALKEYINSVLGYGK